MKQAKFTLNNKELLLVELPDIEDCDPVLVNEYELFINGEYWELPFRVKPIGKLPEVTEEQARLLVHIPEQGNYRCYKMFRGQFHNVEGTAKESFFSKLEAEGVLFENPLPEPEFIYTSDDDGYYDECAVKEYKAAQEKVFNIDNTYLFEKVTNPNTN